MELTLSLRVFTGDSSGCDRPCFDPRIVENTIAIRESTNVEGSGQWSGRIKAEDCAECCEVIKVERNEKYGILKHFWVVNVVANDCPTLHDWRSAVAIHGVVDLFEKVTKRHLLGSW